MATVLQLLVDGKHENAGAEKCLCQECFALNFVYHCLFPLLACTHAQVVEVSSVHRYGFPSRYKKWLEAG
jgi:hypothetical protein